MVNRTGNYQSRSSQGASGLPREYVTCQEIFDAETRRIFSRNWICFDHISHLSSECAIPFLVGDNQLIVVGDGSGSFRAFRNFCRHRGSLLVSEKNCKEIGKRIQCPYHAWTYDRHGRLVAAPNMEGVKSFDKDEFGLVEVPCQLYGGFVWICLNPQQTIDDFLAPIVHQFDSYELNQLTVAHEIVYEVNANWKLIFQNYSECYHCPSVHPILNRLTPYKDSSNDVETGPILGGPMQLAVDCETMSMDGRAVSKKFKMLNNEQMRSVNYFTIFPTIFLSTHPDYVLVHRLERLAVNKTRVVCQFLFQDDTAAKEEFDPSQAFEFWDMTNKQDWEVCELSQEGMNDPAFTPGPYSNLESMVAAFDRYYLSVMHA